MFRHLADCVKKLHNNFFLFIFSGPAAVTTWISGSPFHELLLMQEIEEKVGKNHEKLNHS